MAQAEPIGVFGGTDMGKEVNHQLKKNKNKVSLELLRTLFAIMKQVSLRTELTQRKAKASMDCIPKTEMYLIQK